MASISWPTSGRISAAMEYHEGLQWDVEINVMRNGRAHTRVLPGARWVGEIFVPEDTVSYLVERRQLEALLVQLEGGNVRLNLWNLLTPTPLGTLQTGTPQVASAMAAGAKSVALKNCLGGLNRGDRFQFGSTGQRVIATNDTTPASGNMTVTFEPAARLAAAVDLNIVYVRPYTGFILQTPENLFPYRRSQLPGFSVALVEGYE
jgi:hypothetical protein